MAWTLVSFVVEHVVIRGLELERRFRVQVQLESSKALQWLVKDSGV